MHLQTKQAITESAMDQFRKRQLVVMHQFRMRCPAPITEADFPSLDVSVTSRKEEVI